MSSENTKVPFRIALISLIILIGLTQFTNCGSYSDPDMVGSFSSFSVTCTNPECVTQKKEDLTVRVNIGGGMIYGVPASLFEWNLAGDCNEGGYPYNTVRWMLCAGANCGGSSGIPPIRSSEQPGLGGGLSNVNSNCINGRFMIYVDLRPIPMDNVNRTGLSNGAVRTPYTLKVIINGHMSPMLSGQDERETLISLLPI